MLRNLIQTALKSRKRPKRRGRSRSSAGRARANRLLFESLEPRLVLEGYAALQRPTELQYWDATQADNGYNFYGVGGTSYLLDMEGRVVHTWPIGTNPHLLDNGNVLDAVHRRSQRVQRLQGGELGRRPRCGRITRPARTTTRTTTSRGSSTRS